LHRVPHCCLRTGSFEKAVTTIAATAAAVTAPAAFWLPTGSAAVTPVLHLFGLRILRRLPRVNRLYPAIYHDCAALAGICRSPLSTLLRTSAGTALPLRRARAAVLVSSLGPVFKKRWDVTAYLALGRFFPCASFPTARSAPPRLPYPSPYCTPLSMQLPHTTHLLPHTSLPADACLLMSIPAVTPPCLVNGGAVHFLRAGWVLVTMRTCTTTRATPPAHSPRTLLHTPHYHTTHCCAPADSDPLDSNDILLWIHSFAAMVLHRPATRTPFYCRCCNTATFTTASPGSGSSLPLLTRVPLCALFSHAHAAPHRAFSM